MRALLAGLIFVFMAAALGAQPTFVGSSYPPGGEVGSQYGTFIPVSGGSPPYTWSILGGQLPPGLSLNSSTGEVNGWPSANGTFNVNLQATDSMAVTTQNTYIFVVQTNGWDGPSFTGSSVLPDATVGAFYSTTLTVTGGVAPLLFQAIGPLPPGLSLGSGSGTISGTPSSVGNYSFQIRCTDGRAQPVATTVNTFSMDVVSSVPAQVAWNPTTFNFGSVKVGSSASQVFTLSCTGGTISGTVDSYGPGFAITNGGGAYALNDGQSLQVTVQFTPAVTGAANGQLQATGGGNPVANLSGTAAKPKKSAAEETCSTKPDSGHLMITLAVGIAGLLCIRNRRRGAEQEQGDRGW